MSYSPAALPRPAPQGSSPAAAGRVRRSKRSEGAFPERLWARRVSRIWRRVQAALLAEPPVPPQPGAILPTAHRRPPAPEPAVADPGRAARLHARAAVLLALADRQRLEALQASDLRAAQARLAARAGILQDDAGAEGEARRRAELDPLQALALTARQAEAAATLQALWRDALPALCCPQGWRSGGRGGRHLSEAELARAGEAWRQYQAWMALLHADCGAEVAAALLAVVIQGEPHPAAGRLPGALEYLAAHLGLA